MPQAQTVQNNFKEGLKTEFTGLNFPENAATDTQNTVYTLVGDVNRRGGINIEANGIQPNINKANVARSSYKWLNAGGDGESQILVQQVGNHLFLYLYSNSTTSAPISTTILSTVFDLNTFAVVGGTDTSQIECQYSSGNGYLFVFHPQCQSFYATFFPGPNFATAQPITLQIRDTVGILEPNVPDTFRPPTLSSEHLYNLLNQGWTQGSGYTATSFFNGSVPLATGNSNTTMSLALTSESSTSVIHPGDILSLTLPLVAGAGSNPHNNGSTTLLGTVTAYSSPNVTLTITQNSSPQFNVTGFWSGGNFTQEQSSVSIVLANEGFINGFQSVVDAYPSNSDIWWLYKDTNEVFDPTVTFANVQPLTSPAPKGSFILDPFNQDRAGISQIPGLTKISTTSRPSTGAFYQGRVFYAGVNAAFPAQGDAQYTTWTENIYFSQIVESPLNFGRCYQTNDPTSQNLFDILPSDGGFVTIQGCGNIYKLFPLRFGLLVFAANGIWFLSGSTGIGFTANDFTVTKISSIKTLSPTSFIDMQGYPMFWNTEGIYQVTPPAQAGSAHSPDIQLDVNNLTLGTILTYYTDIPTVSKFYARGDYDPLNYIVQWAFRSTPESGIGNRYSYDTILTYNVVTRAFYPYTLPTTSRSIISDIKYIDYPGGNINAPDPILKYLTQNAANVVFCEENDFTNYADFVYETGAGFDYTSYFTAGYNLPGQALRKIQVPYVYVFSRNPSGSQISIQAIWDFAGSAILGSTDMNSGKWSTRQLVVFNQTDYTMVYRKVRLRGRGMAVQIRIQSISGQPFDIMGWSVLDQVNQVV